MQVSHLHPIQQRLVAHHVLVHADHVDTVEAGDCTVNGVTPIKEEHDEQAG